jgi:hypothetical protein
MDGLFAEGKKVYVIWTGYSSTIYPIREQALDQLRRHDELWSFVVTELKKEEP